MDWPHDGKVWPTIFCGSGSCIVAVIVAGGPDAYARSVRKVADHCRTVHGDEERARELEQLAENPPSPAP